MSRQAVLKRLAISARIGTAIKAFRDTLTRQLAQRPAAPPDIAAAYGPVFAHLSAELTIIERRLDRAETTYELRRGELADIRLRHDRASTELHSLQSDSKMLLESLLGSKHPYELSPLRGATPRDPAALARRVQDTVDILRQVEGAPPAINWLNLDVAALAERLSTCRQSLEESVTGLAEANASSIAARCRADDAVAEFDRIVPCLVKSLESLCQLAGEEWMAQRIRGR